jgi:hypothetical protein
LAKVAQIVSETGYASLARRASGYLYRRTLRRILPRTSAVRYAGVAISRDRKLGDLFVPEFLAPADIRDIPDYERTLIGGIRAHVRSGDKVVIVGGGEGVTATIAAQMAGEDGGVVCFEGAGEGVAKVEATARRNGVASRLTVRHAVVGKPINIHGAEESQSSIIVDPADLPKCDLLELDCEGAEITILQNMNISPRVILVETHGLFGAPSTKVRRLLEGRGYEVVDLGWAEPGLGEACKEHDIRILAARLHR